MLIISVLSEVNSYGLEMKNNRLEAQEVKKNYGLDVKGTLMALELTCLVFFIEGEKGSIGEKGTRGEKGQKGMPGTCDNQVVKQKPS